VRCRSSRRMKSSARLPGARLRTAPRPSRASSFRPWDRKRFERVLRADIQRPRARPPSTTVRSQLLVVSRSSSAVASARRGRSVWIRCRASEDTADCDGVEVENTSRRCRAATVHARGAAQLHSGPTHAERRRRVSLHRLSAREEFSYRHLPPPNVLFVR
jgi:hypothetical protein